MEFDEFVVPNECLDIIQTETDDWNTTKADKIEAKPKIPTKLVHELLQVSNQEEPKEINYF